MRRRLDDARYFVGDIQETLNPKKRAGTRTIQQFEILLAQLAHPEIATANGPGRPVFDRMNLSLAVTEAAKAFHKRWQGLLGLAMNPPDAATTRALGWRRAHRG